MARSSYRRRLRDIQYWRQRGIELEEIIKSLIEQMAAGGIDPKMLIGKGIEGDHFINDVNTGDFYMTKMRCWYSEALQKCQNTSE